MIHCFPRSGQVLSVSPDRRLRRTVIFNTNYLTLTSCALLAWLQLLRSDVNYLSDVLHPACVAAALGALKKEMMIES